MARADVAVSPHDLTRRDVASPRAIAAKGRARYVVKLRNNQQRPD
jgi:hypothetical protein